MTPPPPLSPPFPYTTLFRSQRCARVSLDIVCDDFVAGDALARSQPAAPVKPVIKDCVRVFRLEFIDARRLVAMRDDVDARWRRSGDDARRAGAGGTRIAARICSRPRPSSDRKSDVEGEKGS